MKISRRNYNLIVRGGILLVGAFIAIGLFMPELLQNFYLPRQPTFYALGTLFLLYTCALTYSVTKKDLDKTAKLMQLIRAPLYLCITVFCFYYAWSYS